MKKLFTYTSLFLASQCGTVLLLARPAVMSKNPAPSRPLQLRAPGKYILEEHLNFAPEASNQIGITIAADNVLIDLCGYTITQLNDTPQFTAITITPGHNNITISNGHICSCTASGLIVQANCSNLTLMRLHFNRCQGAINIATANNCYCNDLQLTNHQNFGLQLTDCTNFKLSEFSVNGTTANTTVTAFALTNCSNCTLSDCNANNNVSATTIGYQLLNCNGCILRNCKANNNQAVTTATNPATSVTGFAIQTSLNCQLSQCLAWSNSSTGPHAYGFALMNASRTRLQNCEAVYNLVSYAQSDQTSMAYGFYSGQNQQPVCANIFDHCQATGNAGSSAAGSSSGSAGFYFDQSEIGSSILSSIADGNYGGAGNGIGIFSDGAQLCTLKDNRVLTNTGDGRHGGYGIYDSAAGSQNLYMGNFAFGNGTRDHTTTNNYAVSLAPNNDLTLFPSVIAYINNFNNLATPGMSSYNVEVIERP
ncbi:MAG TPA: hypothetical protein VJJ83_00530 [Candidatus Babeliales bacterium]|nr:hypothetical protein [Candidatus Babeliales bacterium]